MLKFSELNMHISNHYLYNLKIYFIRYGGFA